jgi:hypothetical protein
VRFGSRFIGAVDWVGQESIRTRFRMFVVPLWPIESHFVLEDSLQGFRSFPIPLNPKSVLMGYLRWWAFLGVVLGGIFWWENGSFRLLIWSGLLWALSTLFLGRASTESHRKRLILSHATGLSAEPSYQDDAMRAEIFVSLRDRLRDLEDRLDQRPWPEILKDDGGEKIAAIAYATAAYGIHCDQTKEWEPQAEQAWAAIDSNWNYWINELYS